MTQTTHRSKKATTARRKVQSATTRSRKSVKRPANKSKKTTKATKTSKANKKVTIELPKAPEMEAAEVQMPEIAGKSGEAKEGEPSEVEAVVQDSLQEPAMEDADLKVEVKFEPKISRFSETMPKAEPVAVKIMPAAKEQPRVVQPQPAATHDAGAVKVEFKQPNVIMPQADLSQVYARMRMRQAQTASRSTMTTPTVAQSAETTVSNIQKQSQLQSQHTARQLKDNAIRQALAQAAKQTKKKANSIHRVRLGWQRVALAFSCALAIVLAVAYFVNINSPNISLKVAAMQTGIQASYPDYVPRGFSLTDITSENGKITLNFKDTNSNTAYTITEESSSWDSAALLNNYVKSEYGTDYSAVKEQGLSLYMSDSSREVVWINGGVMYKIKITSGSLTKKQLTNIAVSL